MVVRRLFTPLIISILLIILSCDTTSRSVDEYNLPAVYLDIDAENLRELSSNIFSNRYVDATFVHNDREHSVEIRYHGNLSRLYLKKSYRVKFNDADLFENKKKIVLSSQWSDKSLLRSRLSFELFNKAGLMTSDNRFIALFINNDYKGIYYLIEPIDEFFLANRNKNIGSLYKAIRGKAKFTFAGGYDVRIGFKKKPIDDGNYSDLEFLINILDNIPADSLSEQIEEVLDVENYLHYLAVCVLISNWDGFNKNFHLHRPNLGRFEIIPWDFDLTFGESTWTIYGRNNLSRRLLEVEIYRFYYKDYLLELLNNEFSEESMFSMIDQLSNYIKDAYENDPFLKAKGCGLKDEIQAVKNFIHSRQIYVREQLEDF